VSSIKHILAQPNTVVVNLKDPNFTNDKLEAVFPSFVNRRKSLDPNLLFGSHKPSGALPARPRKQNFSHRRIFGDKKKIVDIDSA
jgi:hypothetical protein